MSIVLSVVEYSTQADGSYSVTERHTDHLGNKYTRVYFAPAGADLEANATAYAAQLETELANAEIDELIDGFE